MKNNKDITLIVKPTHMCDNNCPYCYDKLNRHRDDYTQKMGLDVVEKTAVLFKGRARQWIWHGGEPLLMGVDFFNQANDIILSIDKDIKIDMQTNGNNITQEVIDMYKKYNIRPGLSFDGIDNNLTRRNTSKLMGTFNLLEKNDIEFGAIMVLTPESIKNIIGEYEFAKRINLDLQMNTIYKAQGNEKSTTIAQDITVKYITEFFDYWIHDTYKPIYSGLCNGLITDLLGGQRTLCEHTDCVGKWFGIHPNGNIHPCGRDWGDDMVMGNIMEMNSADDIKENPNFKRYMEETLQVKEKCRKECAFFYACHCGCYGALKNANNGHFNDVDPEYCYAHKKILTHVYNRIKDVYVAKDFDGYNPIFLQLLNSLGTRSLEFIKRETK